MATKLNAPKAVIDALERYIANNSVDFSALADIAGHTLIGRDSADKGDPQSITVGGGLHFTGGAELEIEDSGVEPGTYASPTVTIDLKGRITDAQPGLWGISFSTPDIASKPTSTVLGRAPIPFGWTLPATASTPPGYVEGKVDGAPSADTDFDLLKDGASVGTLRFASGSTTPTLIKAADTAFVAGDYLDLEAPSNLNGMTGVFGVAVMGVR